MGIGMVGMGVGMGVSVDGIGDGRRDHGRRETETGGFIFQGGLVGWYLRVG